MSRRVSPSGHSVFRCASSRRTPPTGYKNPGGLPRPSDRFRGVSCAHDPQSWQRPFGRRSRRRAPSRSKWARAPRIARGQVAVVLSLLLEPVPGHGCRRGRARSRQRGTRQAGASGARRRSAADHARRNPARSRRERNSCAARSCAGSAHALCRNRTEHCGAGAASRAGSTRAACARGSAGQARASRAAGFAPQLTRIRSPPTVRSRAHRAQSGDWQRKSRLSQAEPPTGNSRGASCRSRST
jgi:hypothetical protein